MQRVFIIANRYIVDTTRDTISDKQTSTGGKVEQRLIRVLALLAGHPNEVVSRDRLIKEVWNDYGGGDEALTQAISFLRKLLNDTDRTLIETVPKKGYILHADITYAAPSDEAPEEHKKKTGPPKRKKYTVIALLVVLACSILWLFIKREKPQSPDILYPDRDNSGVEDTIRSGNPDLRPDLPKQQDTLRGGAR
ncbi:MAG: winged helix-turn-helix domain-containing protein [Chitinophagaceae bacterium]|nr:winged helix-turn-helix domain-containing protein [Chitinophagaceae bacterium]